MKKRLLIGGLSAVCAIACAFAIAACGNPEDSGNSGGTDNPGQGGQEQTPGSTLPEAKPEDYEYYKLDEAGTAYQIKSYIGTDKDVTLPSVYFDGKPVTAIYVNYSANSQTEGEYKPFFNSTVETVHIPASITSFHNGYNPFYGAKNLKSITVDENNPSFAAKDGVLYDRAMTKVVACPYNKTDVLDLPATVKEVPLEAMTCYAVSLTTNIFNNTFSTEGTFSSRISGVNLPAEIEDFSFEGCRELQTVNFGNSKVTAIGLGAFRQCRSLKSITLPESLKYIGSEAFQSSGLESIAVPDNVRAVDNYKDLATGGASVSGSIFINCKNLATVTGPAQLLFGERGAADVGSPQNGCKNNFLGCSSLRKITVTASAPGTGGTAWGISDYDDDDWVSSARDMTFTALTELEFLQGVYDRVDTSRIAAFEKDYPYVTVKKS